MAVAYRGHLALARQGLCIAMFACGVILAGLATIHFIWFHPAVIGPFALMIGMTPLVLLFEYSLKVPAYWIPLGTVLAGASWFLLLRNPPRPRAVKAVLLGGGALIAFASIVIIIASAYYNVGMAGEVPTGWYSWIGPASRVGEVGLLLLATGLLIRATLD
jgi:hypothetical protein